MLYLLDANVPITAHNQYYPLQRFPEFWSWLRYQGETGNIKMPRETYEEIKAGGKDQDKDQLYAWVIDADTKAAILLEEEADAAIVARVINEGYAPDLADDELEVLGNDPFLIAYALADAANRCVVTTEGSKPSRKRQNRHIPDVCADLGVNCCNTFELLAALEFTTAWRS
ncbi:MAG TPA: DUF4411 family protein [Candidatus Acidoferrum sp.]|nr:DUF4411 family protein [Candidatus Acidoferrum sp.]